jgi:hypothetical protein
LKCHLKLHADPLKAKRTDFFKEAQAAIDGIDRTNKKKKKTKTEVRAKVEKGMKVKRGDNKDLRRALTRPRQMLVGASVSECQFSVGASLASVSGCWSLVGASFQ